MVLMMTVGWRQDICRPDACWAWQAPMEHAELVALVGESVRLAHGTD
jgi:hypothetical protein